MLRLVISKVRRLFGPAVEQDPVVIEDAADLVRRHGDRAYFIARECVRDQIRNGSGVDLFGPDHWPKVRREVRRMTGQVMMAEGTRFVKGNPR